jgi:competence protein ComEC
LCCRLRFNIAIVAGQAADGVALVNRMLRAPYPGGDTSGSQPFLEAVAPQVALISVGAEDRCGHPAAQALARYAALGIPVLSTVEFVTDGEWLWVHRDR